ncbi:MAG: hypothetical protein V1799_10575 [bacterium]
MSENMPSREMKQLFYTEGTERRESFSDYRGEVEKVIDLHVRIQRLQKWITIPIFLMLILLGVLLLVSLGWVSNAESKIQNLVIGFGIITVALGMILQTQMLRNTLDQKRELLEIQIRLSEIAEMMKS